MNKRKFLNYSDKHYHCEKCGHSIEYGHGDCFLYGSKRPCPNCGGEMNLIRTIECPTCHGGGKITLHVSEWSDAHKGPRPSVEITCVDCEGVGQVTPKALEQIKAKKDMWCKCGNPSGNVEFFENGEHPDLWKHHVRCGDCGKVVQIG